MPLRGFNVAEPVSTSFCSETVVNFLWAAAIGTAWTVSCSGTNCLRDKDNRAAQQSCRGSPGDESYAEFRHPFLRISGGSAISIRESGTSAAAVQRKLLLRMSSMKTMLQSQRWSSRGGRSEVRRHRVAG